MMARPLAEALDRAFPGRVPPPPGLADLVEAYAAHGGHEAIADLDDWVRRRRQCLHPAYGLNSKITERRLPGPQKHGVGAAEIGTVQGHDGRWYARHAAHFGSSGYATPITHSEPFATERDAIAGAAGKILNRALQMLGRVGETSSDSKWARKIEVWCRAQIGQQGELAL